MKILRSSVAAFIVFTIFNLSLAGAGDLRTTSIRMAFDKIEQQGLEQYQCAIGYIGDSRSEEFIIRRIFAKSEKEAYQICLNSEKFTRISNPDQGKPYLSLKEPVSGAHVVVTMVHVYLVK